MVKENKEIKSQIFKLTSGKTSISGITGPNGTSHSKNLHPNAQNIKEVKAIITRNGVTQEDPTGSTIDVAISSNKEDLPKKEVKKNILVQMPFPQALQSTGKVLKNNNEILEHLK